MDHALRRIAPRALSLRLFHLQRSRMQLRALTTTPPSELTPEPASGRSKLDVEALLAEPTWSIASLLPLPNAEQQPVVTSKQLHHLLRLSALPPPKDAADEERMLSTLTSQLHFVREVQSVDTTGVEPLRSLRDETAQGEKEAELGMDALREALEMEEVRGKHHPRVRRRASTQTDENGAKPGWDVLGTAARKIGRYLVVEGGGPSP